MEEIEIFRNFKILEANKEYLIGAKGYKIYKYSYCNQMYEFIGSVDDVKYRLLSIFSLTRRLFRAEVTSLYTLLDDTQIIVAKKGIFRKKKGNKKFVKCFSISRGSRPLNICIANNSELYFGEYFANMDKKAVNIYRSIDYGKTWEVAYTFSEGNINHIHGIFWDKYTRKIWYATGDRENECIIGYTEDGFKTVNEVFRGDQEYRTCNLFFYKDYIVFATDSQYKTNEIKLINRDNLKLEKIVDIQGSAIKGGQVGDIAFLSTTVEPSKVNLDKCSHVWISFNGKKWTEIYKAKKDFLPAVFQFGSIEFPNYNVPISDKIIFSGRAVRKIGGDSMVLKISE